MAEYKECEALIEHMKDLPTWDFVAKADGVYEKATKYPEGMFNCDDVIASIENAPAADVVEVRHGEWISEIGSYCTPRCSACGWHKPYTEDYYCAKELYSPWNYCPNCGADMRGERRQEDA
jgi:hypothetical protein